MIACKSGQAAIAHVLLENEAYGIFAKAKQLWKLLKSFFFVC